MSTNRVESIVDAIARLNGMLDPESTCYEIKNPLLLKSFARLGRHETTVDGLRIFTSTLNGYKAALFDCRLKVDGLSRAKLTGDSTLENLLGAYGITTPGAIGNVVSFIRRALKNQDITKDTTLSYLRFPSPLFLLILANLHRLDMRLSPFLVEWILHTSINRTARLRRYPFRSLPDRFFVVCLSPD